MVVKRRNKTTLVSCSRKFSMESIVVGRVCTYLLSAKAGVLKLRYKIARGSGIIKPSLITFGLGTDDKLQCAQPVIPTSPQTTLYFLSQPQSSGTFGNILWILSSSTLLIGNHYTRCVMPQPKILRTLKRLERSDL